MAYSFFRVSQLFDYIIRKCSEKEIEQSDHKISDKLRLLVLVQRNLTTYNSTGKTANEIRYVSIVGQVLRGVNGLLRAGLTI